MVRHSNEWDTDYVAWLHSTNSQSKWVTPVDFDILKAVEFEARPWWGDTRLSQGGLSDGSLSAGTHKGFGAYDESVRDPKTGDYRPLGLLEKKARLYLRSGIVPFIRGYGLGRSLSTDPFRTNRHFHLVSRESYDHMQELAQRQYKEYKKWLAGDSNDGDGLVGAHPFPGPNPPGFERWATSPYNPANIKADTGVYYVDVKPGSILNGVDVDRNVKRRRERGFEIQSAKQVLRWGRWNIVTEAATFYAADFLSATKPL